MPKICTCELINIIITTVYRLANPRCRIHMPIIEPIPEPIEEDELPTGPIV